MKLLNWFASDESGQSMTEYSLIIALIAVVLVGALSAVGGALSNTFNKVVDEINNLPSGN